MLTNKQTYRKINYNCHHHNHLHQERLLSVILTNKHTNIETNNTIADVTTTMSKEQPKSALLASFFQSLMDDIARDVAAYGSDHPAVAESQTALGLFYHHVSHEPKKALLCHVKALTIYKTSISSSDQQKQEQEQEQEQKVEQEQEQKLEQKQKRPQQNQNTIVEMGITITDIGNVQWALGDHKKAMWAFEDSLAVFISAGLEHNHPRIVSTQNRLKVLLEHFRVRAKSIGSLATIEDIDGLLIRGNTCERKDYQIDRYCTCT